MVELAKLEADVTRPFTYEAWALSESTDSKGKILNTGVVPFRQWGSGWQFGVMTASKNAPGGNKWSSVQSPPGSVTNRWQHVAGTWDPQTQEVTLFLDGKLIERKRIGKADPDPPTPMMMGAWDAFKGQISELRVSSVVRYVRDFPVPGRLVPDKETLALYHFDEGQGNVLADSSGNERHGKIVGAKWINLPKAHASHPPPAKAPFDAKAARAHQEAWAKHLGTTVETTNSVGAKMVLIPPGEFQMGSTPGQHAAGKKLGEDDTLKPDDTYWQFLPHETPQHTVILTKPFLLGATEVTIGQFRKFVEGTKYVTDAQRFGFGNSTETTLSDKVKESDKGLHWTSSAEPVGDEYPVRQITWNDACAYCAWLSEQEGRTPGYRFDAKTGGWQIVPGANGYRLPTEAEWEYACRAGTTTQFSSGDEVHLLSQYELFANSPGYKLQPAGSKLPNAFGLYDMAGSLREWCQDFYLDRLYEQGPAVDPLGSNSGRVRAIRGGSWAGKASYCRSAYRYGTTISNRNGASGFRVVRLVDDVVRKPPSAEAPFDAKQARGHQEAWAKFLGTQVETTNDIGLKLVLLPPGEFQMGSTPEQIVAAAKASEKASWSERQFRNETPRHAVTISRPMLFGSTEVTVGQFRKFVLATKYVTETERLGGGRTGSGIAGDPKLLWSAPGGKVSDEAPVTQLTWGDCAAFCNWLSEQHRLSPGYRLDAQQGWLVLPDADGYRLPTEAEWEYACRAGATTEYSWGADPAQVGEHGWYKVNANRTFHAVGTSTPNAFGLFDLHGNVWEYCQDWLDGKWYAASPGRDPLGPETGSERVVRGGSIYSEIPIQGRAAYRGLADMTKRGNDTGFRVVRTLQAPGNAVP